MDENRLTVRLWGVRGSYPVPGQRTVTHGGNTSCVEVNANGHIVILDAGTGIIPLGHHLMQERHNNGSLQDLTIILTHTHGDHISGFPFFAPAYHPDTVIHLYGPKSFPYDVSEIMINTMQAQYSPVELRELSADIGMCNISDHECLIFNSGNANPKIVRGNHIDKEKDAEVVVSLMRSYAHPKVGTFVIKVEAGDKRVVYATDTEGYVGHDTRLIDFAREANLLIHDAQYTPEEYLKFQGFGHSSNEMAAEVAAAAQVEHLVLFHHDPNHTDSQLDEMEKKAQRLFPKTTAGAEGQTFTF
jgi:ribonuclease BN (tRNA processing enzyme)